MTGKIINMKIQKATTKDAKILEQIFSVLYKPKMYWSEDKLYEDIKDGKKFYYLVLRGNKILGAFGIKFDDLNAKFGPLVVKEECRQKGIGSKLLNFAEGLTRKRGLDRIWCHSFERYGVANFYKKNGWEEEKFIKDYWDGQNCFVFAKKL